MSVFSECQGNYGTGCFFTHKLTITTVQTLVGEKDNIVVAANLKSACSLHVFLNM